MSIAVVVVADGEVIDAVVRFPTEAEAYAFERGITMGSMLGTDDCNAFTLADCASLVQLGEAELACRIREVIESHQEPSVEDEILEGLAEGLPAQYANVVNKDGTGGCLIPKECPEVIAEMRKKVDRCEK